MIKPPWAYAHDQYSPVDCPLLVWIIKPGKRLAIDASCRQIKSKVWIRNPFGQLNDQPPLVSSG